LPCCEDSRTVVTTPLVSFQEISAEWEDLLTVSPVNTLFLTPQWQEVWWDTFNNGKGLAGFYLNTPDGVAAIASLARSGDTLSFLGNQDTFDYNDFMVSPGYEDIFFDALLRCLGEQNCNTLELFSLIESSPTLTHLPEMARDRGYLVEVEQEDVTFGIELPGTWDEYLAVLTKKDRHELRRKFRRLESTVEWRWYSLTDPEEVAGRLGDFIRLMRQSRKDKDEYMTPERERFFQRVTQKMAQQGLLKLFFMDIDGQSVATSLCFDYSSSRLLYNSGYNPDYGYYSVGLLLNALCLREAIEGRIGYFDFLRGSEPYKHHLGGQQRNLYQMVVRRS
jgi:CelD/BcsL family acetyltransferase involved in cellulose biosynthesis